MSPFDGPPQERRESARERTIRKTAEEALFWIEKGEFERDQHAIFRAIKNAGLNGEKGIYRVIKDALHALPEWKAMKQAEKEHAEQSRELEAERKAQHMREAYAHQMRQPRDAWDPFADEKDED